MPVYFIEDFIRAKSSWIEKQQKKYHELQAQKKENSDAYFLFGERYSRGTLTEKEVTAIERETLRDYVSSRIDALTRLVEPRKPVTKIRISSARTRWGSCSSAWVLSFSYRLVAYPRVTIDAVIIHELAHLRVANHSQKFWDIVYRVCPEYEKVCGILRDGML